MMKRRAFLHATAAAVATAAAATAGRVRAAEPLRVGVILPMTGPFATYGTLVKAGMDLWRAEHGTAAGGREVELLLKDDGGVADITKRLAQELITQDGAEVLAGFGLTPLALATAPLSARAKVPMLVTVAATSIVTEKSPYAVRVSYTTPQVTSQIAEWSLRNGSRRAMTLVMDYGPGLDAEKTFAQVFAAGGGEVVEAIRVPLQNPDFAPFLQRVADAAPELLFVFLPSGIGAPFLKQYVERGLDRSGLKLIADGSVTDEFVLDAMGEPALGLVTGLHYSDAHPSELNRAFVAAFRAANPGLRPNFMAVAGYDAMQLLATALEATGGDANGDVLVAAMRGQAWESPRGPIAIDPDTRDIVQNVYMRRVERTGGRLANVEFETFEAVKDPGKSGS